jgi:hypothetical protein
MESPRDAPLLRLRPFFFVFPLLGTALLCRSRTRYFLRETSMILITKAEKAMQSIAIPIAFEVNMVITSICSIIGKTCCTLYLYK